MMELRDKVVLVTGGANGIGRALCRRFAAEGVRGLAVVDLAGARPPHGLAAELGPDAIGLAADVGQEADVVAAVRATEERFGPIDLLVSNAGIGTRRRRRGAQRGLAADLGRQPDGPRLRRPRRAARRCSPAARATSSTPRRPPGCSPTSAPRPTASPSTPPSGWPSGSPSPTATRASRCRACARRACARTCCSAGADDAAGAVVLAQGAIEPEEVAEAVVQGLRGRVVPDPPPPRGAHLLPAQGRRLRPLARRHAQAPAPHRRRPVVTGAEAAHAGGAGRERACSRSGCGPGDRVRFRRVEGGAWKEARVERRERDGSIGVRDERGAARAIPVERLQVRTTGPRGGATWEDVAERAGRSEQLGIW